MKNICVYSNAFSKVILSKTLCLLAVSILFTGFSFTKSNAIESISIDNNQTIIKPIPKRKAESCESFLKKAKYSYKSERRNTAYSRPARKAAMLSIVLGMKFAIGPKEIRNKKKAKISLWALENNTNSQPQAIAVAAYRKCKNEEALKAISKWRWQR